MSRRPPPAGEVHLAWVDLARAGAAELRARYAALMNEAERVRHDRFLFAEKRHEFLVTRALVRSELSRYADVDPAAWTFDVNAWGRPEVASPVEHRGLSFNLSNTFGMVAIVVADGREVGCDVEDVERHGQTIAVADRFFSAREVEDLRGVPPEGQRRRFFDYWTLKEAYIKARGMGLAIPLGSFSFLLDAGGPVRVAFEPSLGDDPASWQFEQLRPSARHVISVAVRRRDEPDVRLVVREVVPLADEAAPGAGRA